MPTARLCALLSAFILSLVLAPTSVIAKSNDQHSPLGIQLELGPSFAAFSGGGASESGTGFVGSLSFLVPADESEPRGGLRIGYDAYFYKDIEKVTGQQLREQVFTVGAILEYPFHEHFSAHVHGGLGGVASKADVVLFPPIRTAVDSGGFVTELGGGMRYYPIRNLYLSGELNLNLIVGSAADLVDVNFRASVLLGGSF